MRKLKKFLVLILFSFLFSILVLTSTINFLIFNKDFLFYVFEKHDLYQKVPRELSRSFVNDPNLSEEEKLGYALIINNISKEIIEDIAKKNITGLINFVRGNSSELVVYFPAQDLQLGAENINWSLSEDVPLKNKGMLMRLNGIWNLVFIVWAIILSLLTFLFFIYGKVSQDKLAGRRLFITNGAFLFISGLFLYIIPSFIVKTFPENIEPSQVFIKILATTVIAEIAFAWLIFGALVFMFGIILVLYEKMESNKPRLL